MNYVVPVLLAAVIAAALISKTPVYSSFTAGAAEGLKIVVGIFPAMLAIMTAAYMLRASGAFELLTSAIAPITEWLGIPDEIIPLMMIRPVSGSGAIGILTDILNTCGADSEAGLIASVITGSTETTFYCVCVYFADTRVKYSAKVIPCALIGDFVGMALGIIMVKLMLI